MVLQSPSLKSMSPKSSVNLRTPPVPSPLATDLSTKLNLPSFSPSTVQQRTSVTPVHVQSVETSRTQEKPNLINFSLNPLQDSKLNLQQKESVLSVASSKSSPLPQLPPNDDASSDLVQSIEAPPTTSQHTSLDGSHSIVEEKGPGEGGGRENGDENDVSGQIAEESPPPKSSNPSHSLTSDGSTTPEPSPSSQQPTSGSQHTDTPSTANFSHTQDTTPSLQSSTSVASSSRRVAFSVEGVSPSMSAQLGLFSPGSLQQHSGLSFQTPPSSSSYQLMSELPPTPFQDANFDLDSSSESEHEEENHRQLSREGGDSFDSSYFRRLQKRVVPLISQEDIEASSLNYHELEGVISQADVEEEPQPKLVDIDQSPSFPTDLQPPMRSHHHGVLDSANSLKVDDLLGFDSPDAPQVPQQSPLLKTYQSPQVGLLVDIRTPGSNLSGKPLLTSTVQGHQVSATSQEQRGHVSSPTSDILLPYLPSRSGTESGALTLSSVDSQRTWSSLMNTSKPSSCAHCSQGIDHCILVLCILQIPVPHS